MDVSYGDFVWNVHKEKANILKHGVGLAEASQVFWDAALRIYVDDAHSVTEERYFGVGDVNGRIMMVRFTYRNKKIRIFGAGYWRKGKGLYEKKKD